MEVKLGDQVTENSERHEKFQLLHAKENNEKWQEGKTGTLLQLFKGDGTAIIEILLGKDRTNGAGQYLRFVGENSVYLIAESLVVRTLDEDWLDTRIMDVEGKKEIKSLSLQHTNLPILHLTREKAEDEWGIADAGEKESLQQDEVNSLVGTFKDLQFMKILPAVTPATETGRESLSQVQAELFDGRKIIIDIGNQKISDDEYYYISIHMQLNEEITDENSQKEVGEFNARSRPWLYALSASKGGALLKTRPDLVSTP